LSKDAIRSAEEETMRVRHFLTALAIAALVGVSVNDTAFAQASSRSVGRPEAAPGPSKVDPALAERLKRILVPLLSKMDNPIPLNEVKVAIMQDPHINAGNAGGGEFLVTTGLLQKANDDQLRAIMAHEIAHADLGHVAQQQTTSAIAEIGVALLDQIWPGSRALTPVVGELVQRHYGRGDEYEADAHGATIMRRAGYDGKKLMGGTLDWLGRTEGNSPGGFFATHPATGDRIQAVQNLPQ
jgi:predicted Zn-dependent protease